MSSLMDYLDRLSSGATENARLLHAFHDPESNQWDFQV